MATAGKNSAGVLTTSQLLHSPTAYCLWHYTNQHSLSSAGGKISKKKKVHREAAQAPDPPYLGSFSLMSFPPASSLIFFKSTVPSLYLHPPLLLCPLIPLLPSPWAVPSVCLLWARTDPDPQVVVGIPPPSQPAVGADGLCASPRCWLPHRHKYRAWEQLLWNSQKGTNAPVLFIFFLPAPFCLNANGNPVHSLHLVATCLPRALPHT